MIHRIRIKNFKSIKEVEVLLSPVTVLVGRSGSGKSNFVDAIRFLRDYLITLNESNQQPHKSLLTNWQRLLPATSPKAEMSFDVEFSITSISERFNYELNLIPQNIHGFPLSCSEEKLRIANRTLFHQKTEAGSRGAMIMKWVVEPELLEIPKAGPAILGKVPSIFDIAISYTALTSGIGCYTFPDSVLTEPYKRTQSKPSNPQPSIGLEDNARNYLQSLKEIVSNLHRLDLRKDMIATLQRVNPSVASVELDNLQEPDHIVVGHRFDDRTLSLSLAQESCGFRRFYAHLLALYQQPAKQTLIFEHPEDGIHPGALSLLAEEFVSAPNDGRGQVLLTTHSPELLNHFDVDQIRVVKLDGFETRIGNLSEEQRESVRENLLQPGELLTVDPARIEETSPVTTEA